ncbi:diphthine--ammonia ligase [Thaumasiovibrio subtropicus]|uniref:Dph6-related ATP pyrophosphatase n=1 Tax=Thaumasiovibrio subtropicus TaxID=1891207 RepID=UPI000B3552D6|nr:diphthine--ammonia ligase [Thaumasiovibrio subtropicus]
MSILNAYFNWSSGKDSAMALYHAQQDPRFEIHTLLTTVNETHRRVSMHGLRVELLDKQADALGLPLHKIWLPETVTMEEYDTIMKKEIGEIKAKGWEHTIFGDIFLEDLRSHREAQLAPVGIQAHFPLWKRDTRELLDELLSLGFRAVVVAIDGSKLDQSFVGRELNAEFIADLPKAVDPCGENGEFHTFVFDGPNFSHPVAFEKDDIVHKHYKADHLTDSHPGFYFQELIPR